MTLIEAALKAQEERFASTPLTHFAGDHRKRNKRTNASPERIPCVGNCGKLRYASQLNKRAYRCRGCGG